MTDTIHPAAARGFDGTADLYDRARPGYPEDAVAAIVERLDLRPGRTVLELGAGTGKLTTLLVPTGVRIVALEPVPGMRSKLAAALGASRSSRGQPRRSPCPRARSTRSSPRRRSTGSTPSAPCPRSTASSAPAADSC